MGLRRCMNAVYAHEEMVPRFAEQMRAVMEAFD